MKAGAGRRGANKKVFEEKRTEIKGNERSMSGDKKGCEEERVRKKSKELK